MPTGTQDLGHRSAGMWRSGAGRARSGGRPTGVGWPSRARRWMTVSTPPVAAARSGRIRRFGIHWRERRPRHNTRARGAGTTRRQSAPGRGAAAGPARSRQRLLRRILGEIDVAQDPARHGEEPRREVGGEQPEGFPVAVLGRFTSSVSTPLIRIVATAAPGAFTGYGSATRGGLQSSIGPLRIRSPATGDARRGGPSRQQRRGEVVVPAVVPYLHGQDDDLPARGIEDRDQAGRSTTGRLGGRGDQGLDPARSR